LLIGVFLIVAAVLLDAYREATAEFVTRTTHSLFWTKPETWIVVLKELGFAFLISLVISVGIEESSRIEFNQTVNDRIREIQLNVFRSTYGLDLDPKITNEIEALVLQSPFVRSKYEANYKIQLFPARWLNPNCPSNIRVAKVHSTVFYTVKNISKRDQIYEVKKNVEKSPIQELKPLTRITGVTIGGRIMSAAQLLAADERIEDSEFQKCFSEIVTIRSGESLDVHIASETIKFEDDNEIWTSLIPSDDMTLRVEFPAEVRKCAAGAIHRSPLIEYGAADGALTREWRIREAVLPHQGISFWWHCSADVECSGPDAPVPGAGARA